MNNQIFNKNHVRNFSSIKNSSRINISNSYLNKFQGNNQDQEKLTNTTFENDDKLLIKKIRKIEGSLYLINIFDSQRYFKKGFENKNL